MSNTNSKNHSPGEAKQDCNECSRRKFLTSMTYFLSGIIGVIVGLPVVGFILAPIFRARPKVWRDVGAVDSSPIGVTQLVEFEDSAALKWAGVTARSAAWLRRDTADGFTCFAVNCTHLGCPVRWDGEADLFMCPCHGGVYYKNGDVAAGPPPKPLHHYAVRVRKGRIELQPKAIPISRFYI